MIYTIQNQDIAHMPFIRIPAQNGVTFAAPHGRPSAFGGTKISQADRSAAIPMASASGGSKEPSGSLAQIQSGSAEVFWKTCELHRKQLLRAAFRITKNSEDAEDAVQEAMIRAYTRREGFEGKCTFATWLTTIVINLCLMELRRRRRRNVSSDESWDEDGAWRETLDDKRESAETVLLTQEKLTLLQNAVSRLQPGLRAMIADRLSEISLTESARDHGITVAAAKSRMLRARKALRRDVVRATDSSEQPGLQCVGELIQTGRKRDSRRLRPQVV